MDALLKDYAYSLETLIKIQKKIREAFNKGLTGDHDEYHYAPLKMLPTHLHMLPDGSEAGCFIAIDLGGTNLRFVEISIVESKLETTSVRFTVPTNVMTGTGEKLFDFIAESIENSLKKHGWENKVVEYLGFTFSFPCNQLALDSALLIRWTKGYSASGVEGKDVVHLLRQACEKRNLKINNFVLINDTTGTLLCGAYEDHHAKIGVINGTGTNACYLELISKIEKWKAPKNTTHKRVIINTEWGSFGENGELSEFSTDIDKEIDRTSINSGCQIFEKMISGMYIGNIARLLILKLIEKGVISDKGLKKILSNHDSFPTSMISHSYSKDIFLNEFEKLYGRSISDEDFICVAQVCDVVSNRSSSLCAVGLAAILERIDCPKGVIAADGSLFTQHPKFVEYVTKYLKLLARNREFKIMLVNDGSGKGAALAACVASVELQKQKNGHS